VRRPGAGFQYPRRKGRSGGASEDPVPERPSPRRSIGKARPGNHVVNAARPISPSLRRMQPSNPRAWIAALATHPANSSAALFPDRSQCEHDRSGPENAGREKSDRNSPQSQGARRKNTYGGSGLEGILRTSLGKVIHDFSPTSNTQTHRERTRPGRMERPAGQAGFGAEFARRQTRVTCRPKPIRRRISP
jgi:hypothetical protein